jgi:hypothetical protein
MPGRPPKVPEVKHRFPPYEESEKLKAIYAAQDAIFRVQPFNVEAFSKLDNALEAQIDKDHADYDEAKKKYYADLRAAANSATRRLRKYGIAGLKSTSKSKSKSATRGGGCGCSVPRGGYRATRKNKVYLSRWRQGKSIGFTMRSSLKAKGLIPRANGRKIVSAKYR